MDKVRLPNVYCPWRRWIPVIVAACAVLASACAGSPEPEFTPTTIDADRVLFERGTAALEEEDWLRAREYFIQVRDNYPQSQYRPDSRLGIGDAFIGQGTSVNYVSAANEFQEFLSLYPTNPRAPYALYKIGLIDYLQMRDPERDQSYTRNAVATFESFIQRYPNSDLMPQVRGYLREARNRLSASEVVVGRYYYRNKWWPGAVSRLQAVLDEDPAYDALDAVYFYLASAYHGRGTSAEALPLFERLLEEYPESAFLEDVNRILPEVQAAAASQAQTDAENEETAQHEETAESETASAPTR